MSDMLTIMYYENQVIFVWINAEFLILLMAFYGVKIKRVLRKIKNKVLGNGKKNRY